MSQQNLPEDSEFACPNSESPEVSEMESNQQDALPPTETDSPESLSEENESASLEDVRPNDATAATDAPAGLPEENASATAPKENSPKGKSKAASEPDVVCITVTGSPEGVRETLLTLYRLGFAEFNDWSPAQRAVNPQQVISVLIRRRKRKA